MPMYRTTQPLILKDSPEEKRIRSFCENESPLRDVVSPHVTQALATRHLLILLQIKPTFKTYFDVSPI
jgi:hypothetical protein